MATTASSRSNSHRALEHLLRHDHPGVGASTGQLVSLAETRLRRLRTETDELQAALLDLLRDSITTVDVGAPVAFASVAAAPVVSAPATAVASGRLAVDYASDPGSDIVEEVSAPVTVTRPWARIYAGDGETHLGQKYNWVDPSRPITEAAFRHDGPPGASELLTVFTAAPLWRLHGNDRVHVRPCRWLARPQLGVFIRATPIRAGECLIRCRTTLTREAGGYDISLHMERWHREYRRTRRDQKCEFFVSPECASIYLNCGDRGLPMLVGGGNNCQWTMVPNADGTARLTVTATRDLKPWEELLIEYGWDGPAWATANRNSETLMARYLGELTGAPGYDKYPATLAPANNKMHTL